MSEEVKITIELESEKAKKLLNEFCKETNQNLENIKVNTEKVKQEFSRLEIKFKDLISLFATKQLLNWTTATIKEVAILKDTMIAFENQFGVNAELVLNKLKNATNGTISELELITSTSKALSTGITNNINDIVKLFEIARQKANLMGIDTLSAFDMIVTGISRGSPQILNRIGILVQGFNENSKSVDDLNERLNLLQLILKQNNENLQNTEKRVLTNKEVFLQFKNTISDLGEVIGSALLPPIIKVTETLTKILQFKENFTGFFKNIKDIAASTSLKGAIEEYEKISYWLRQNEKDLKHYLEIYKQLKTKIGEQKAANSELAEIITKLQVAIDQKKIKLIELSKEIAKYKEYLYGTNQESTKDIIIKDQQIIQIDRYKERLKEIEKQKWLTLEYEMEELEEIYNIKEGWLEKEVEAQKRMNSEKLKNQDLFFNSLLTGTQNFNKKLFQIIKIADSTRALLNAYVAASEALKDPTAFSFWDRMARYAAVLSTGLQLVSAIQGLSYGGGSGGVSTGGGSGVGGSSSGTGSLSLSNLQTEQKPQIQIYITGNIMSKDFILNEVIPELEKQAELRIGGQLNF